MDNHMENQWARNLKNCVGSKIFLEPLFSPFDVVCFGCMNRSLPTDSLTIFLLCYLTALWCSCDYETTSACRIVKSQPCLRTLDDALRRQL